MLSSAMLTALTGLDAASKRFTASARNTANIQSTSQTVDGQVVREPYQPEMVSQTALSTGGVKAEIVKSPLDPYLAYSPDHPDANAEGFVEFPNIDLSREIVNQIFAEIEYKANLNVIRKAKEMGDHALDIFS